jgi:hypothetical protein
VGTSFVTIDGEHGFWMRDNVLVLWLRLLALHVVEPARGYDSTESVKRIHDRLLSISTISWGGCVPNVLPDVIAAPGGADLVRDAIHSLMRTLRQGPPILETGAIQLLGFKEEPLFRANVNATKLLEVGQAFLDLMDGKILFTARSTDFIPGGSGS